MIVTADHGEHFGEHALYGHASSLYDQEVRVPLVIVPPRGGAVGSGRRAGGEPPRHPGDGRRPGRARGRFPLPGPVAGSVAGLPGGKPESPADRAVLVEVEEPAQASPNQGRSPIFRGSMKAVIADGKAYIRNGDGVEELYDLASDPGESHDLAGSPESAPATGAVPRRAPPAPRAGAGLVVGARGPAGGSPVAALTAGGAGLSGAGSRR